MTRFEYNGMQLQTNGDALKPNVKVFCNSCFLNPTYITTSLDQAMRWVDAYQKGEQWAVDARLMGRVG